MVYVKDEVFTDVVQDPALLEFAWVELVEKNKSVTAEELAEVWNSLGVQFLDPCFDVLQWPFILQMIFGTTEPLESYCAHLLLSKDEIYFSVLETKGSRSLYGPRPAEQVCLGLCFTIWVCVKLNYMAYLLNFMGAEQRSNLAISWPFQQLGIILLAAN